MKRPFRKLTVTWLDACSDDDEWWDIIPGTPYKAERHEVTTQGILIGNNDEDYIVVAQTYGPVPGEKKWLATNLFHIPRGCIVRPKTLRKRR
jgi:hypothetical protein